MCDCRGATIDRQLCELCSLQTSLCTHTQRVKLATPDITGDEVTNNGVKKCLPAVQQDVFDSAKLDRPLVQCSRSLLVDAAGIDRGSNYIPAGIFLKPRHAKRRVEPT